MVEVSGEVNRLDGAVRLRAPRDLGALAADGPALLAFDTSTERLAVAALGPRGCATINAPGGPAASAQLLPQIHAALAAAGLALADVEAIGFGRGPGAFTGLRTSCAVAQGLGLGLERPLVPLDSLMLVAEDAWWAEAPPPSERRVAVAMDARMDEIYGAVYERVAASGHEAWAARREPALFTLDAWNALVDEHAHGIELVVGSALAPGSAFAPRLRRVPGARVVGAEHDRAGALLRLALAAWQAGAGVDAAEALPLYLRDKVALTTAERAAARDAAEAASHTSGKARSEVTR